MKRLVGLLLSLTMMISLFSGVVYVNAEEEIAKGVDIVETGDFLEIPSEVVKMPEEVIEGMDSVPFKEEAELSAAVENLAQGYTNRFIVKNNGENVPDNDVISAYSDAQKSKIQAVDEIRTSDEDSFAKLDLDDTYDDNEVAISAVARDMINTSIGNSVSDNEIMIYDVDNNTIIIELPEVVDSEIFVENLTSKLGNSVEYVQPDYILEVSDFEDEEVSEEVVEEIADDDSADFKIDENFDVEVTDVDDKVSTDDLSEEWGNKIPEETDVLISDEHNSEENGEFEVADSDIPAPEPTLSPDADIVNNLQDDIQAAWQITKGAGARIAVIDGKIDVTHPEFSSQVVSAYDIVNDTELTYDSDISSEYDHGTHVTGIIASTVPEAEIIAIAAFNNGQAYTSDIIKAIEYAQEQGADIVNCSFGSGADNPALREAMENSGMIFVCAAGNNRLNVDETPIYPATFDIENVISVASLNQDLGFSYYSNYGENIDVAMYGRNVYNTLPGGEYGDQSGTSMAAAYVTAAAAMIKSIDSELNIKERILDTSIPLSNLLDKVNGGRKISYSNLAYNIVNNDVVNVYPEDDFDVNGYVRTVAEDWELFHSVETVHIEAGGENTAFIKSDGSLWMTGDNSYGQLGIGSTTKTYSATPVQVIGVSDVKQVAIGLNHCIALDSKGYAYVWGNNAYKAVSSSSDSKIYTPVIHPISNIEYVEAGTNTTFVINRRSGIYASGLNDYGQIGNGSRYGYVSTPTLISGSQYANIVKSYGRHTFFIKDGELWGFGSNDHNVLNSSISGTQLNPVELGYAKDLDTGNNHIVTIDSEGAVHAWGANDYGQCGTGTDGQTPLNIKNAVSVKCGHDFSMALLRDGSVLTWGYNNDGQIGDSSDAKRFTPYTVTGIKTPVAEIAAGTRHSMVLDDNYEIWKWGYNGNGQYGNGSTYSYFYPNKYMGKSPVIKKTAIGESHELYIDSNGKLYAKGGNSYGQLGTGDNNARENFVEIAGPWGEKKVVRVETRKNTTFVITEDAVLYGWGLNTSYQLGIGTVLNENAPVQIATDVVNVLSGAMHTVIMKTNGDVYGWGYNTYGQLIGSGNVTEPKLLYSDAYGIGVGDYQTYVISKNYVLYAAGYNNKGQLGTGNTTTQSDFVSVYNNVYSVSGGTNHTIIRTTSNKVYTFGDNTYGQLGVSLSSGATYSATPVDTGKTSSYIFAGGNSSAYIQGGKVYQTGTMSSLIYTNFTPINNISNIANISLGDNYALSVDSNNVVYRWGAMNTNISASNESVINSIHYPYSISDIDAGRDQVLAINGLGQVIAWGEGYYANGNQSIEVKTYPTVIDGISYAKQVCRGKDHNLVLDMYGYVWCWGSNTDYPMGNKLSGKVKTATRMPDMSNVKQVAAGEGFSLFLKNDGTLWGVGNNLGLGYSGGDTSTPVRILQDKPNITFTKVSAGDDYVIALTSDGIYVWGNNDKYQQGNGTKVVNVEPTKLNISLRSGEYFTDVSAGTDACAALTNIGNLYTWGDYGEGLVNDTGKIKTPSLILSGVSKVSVGKKHALAIKYDGTVYSWGYGYKEQLGYKAESVYMPREIMNLNGRNISEIACGYDCSVAVDSYGNMYTFGSSVIPRLYKGTLANLSDTAIPVYNYTIDMSNNYSIKDSLKVTGQENVYKFIPKTSDTYIFTTVSDMDTVGYLYDSSGKQIAYNDDSDGANNRNFKISYSLTAGRTYYIKVRGYSGRTGVYSLYIETPTEVTIY